MGARTTAREAALQILFAVDSTNAPIERAITNFWRETPGDAEGRFFADETARGVVEALGEVDQLLTNASQNWRIERMTRVDRNVLRIGAYELRFRHDIPRAVILDECVELAKRYGTEDSGKFVNGVLERIATDLGRPVETI
jgi:N utilization substance protein B